MILFYKDWERHPNVIIDLKTRSESALKTATIYKKMGIRNNAFHLQLHNPILSGIDVYKETSSEIKLFVAEELSINPWYYFREIAMAPASGGAIAPPFRLNRANVALYWLFFNHLTSILIQCRQTGKTLSLDQLKINLLQYFTTNASMGLLTKNSPLRKKNIDGIKELMDDLPRWLDFRTKKDSNNTENITVNALNNELTTAVAQTTKAAAMGIFRGETKPIIDIDEAAFIANIDLSLAGMLPAMTAARDNAAADNLPYGLNFTTTAGYLDTPSGKYVYDELYLKAARFNETLFDLAGEEELYKVVAANGHGSMNNKVLIEMNHRDLGYTDEWLTRKISETMVTKSQAEAEFLLRWNNGSTESALPAKVIKRLQDAKIEPVYTKIYDSGFMVSWYITEEQVSNLTDIPFLIAIDSSDAVGNDGISFIIRDYKSGIVLGAGNYSLANLDDFGDFVFEFMMEFISSVLIIESRSSAMGILDQLAKLLHSSGQNIFKRVFNWIVSDRETNANLYKTLLSCSSRDLPSFYIECKKHFGYSTSGAGRTARSNLYGRSFIPYVSSMAEYVYDRTLVSQLSSLVTKNDRIDHVHNKHDDMVIAFLLISWFLHHDNNLEFYGFDSSLVLTKVLDTKEDSVDQAKRESDKRQSILMEQLASLLEKLKVASNESEFFIIESRIRLLKDTIGDSITYKNVEARIQDTIASIQKNKHKSTSRRLDSIRW